jgi:integrase
MVQEMLGHATLGITADIYTHVFRSPKQDGGTDRGPSGGSVGRNRGIKQ